MPTTHPRVPIHNSFRALAVALLIFGLILATVGAVFTLARPAAAAGDAEPTAGLYAFEAKRLDGQLEKLDRYRGQVLLIVNTASRCGYTPQYEALQALYEEKRDRGLVVLGFPSNDFGNQEPGSDRQIGEFCKLNYGVDFPMFSKVEVGGPDAHPVYAYLTSQPKPVGGPVAWNFQKYLVDRDGRVVSKFESRVKPDDPKLVSAVDALLASPKPTAGETPRVMYADGRKHPILYAASDR